MWIFLYVCNGIIKPEVGALGFWVEKLTVNVILNYMIINGDGGLFVIIFSHLIYVQVPTIILIHNVY